MLLWGLAYAPSGWLVDAWPPLTAAGLRSAVGGIALLAVLGLQGRSLRPRVGVVVIGWLALTQTALFYGATFWGIAHSGAGVASVLANTDPLFVAILAALFLGERLARPQWLGLIVGLFGASCVVWQGPLWPPELSPDATVVVGGAVAWSLGTIVAARSVRADAEPFALAGWQMTIGGVALASIGMVAEQGVPPLAWREVGLVAGIGILGAAAPLALFYFALRGAQAAEVSAWFVMIPVIGVLSAWPLLGEPPTTRLVVGLVGVSLGLWLVLSRARPRRGVVGRLADTTVSTHSNARRP